jgi:hypothetical protein
MSALADWLGAQAPGYVRTHRVSAEQLRALMAIMKCRTPDLGGRLYRCTTCSRFEFAYHSCNHRSCPRCGGERTATWTARQLERLLPVSYFMVTLTLPEPLRRIFAAQPKVMIDLMFNASAAAMQAVAAIPRHLGARLGITSVLHTWGRQMQLHPHLHLIVPGGGLRADGTWATPKKPDYLLPHRAVAAAFRARMDEGVLAALPAEHAKVPKACWRGAWVVNIVNVGHGEAAIKYLARYVQRTAISDSRIQIMDEDSVQFGYIDSVTQLRKTCIVDADEFMRRYLQHVLPTGIHRVRYFGWEHPAAGRRRRQIETVLAVPIVVTGPEAELVRWHLNCRHCRTETLVCVGSLPRARAPPWFGRWAA